MKMLGCSHVLPSKLVTNHELIDEIISVNRDRLSQNERESLRLKMDKWFARSGTQVRYHRSESETAAELTVRAGRQVLETTGVKPGDVDLLIYAGVGRGVLEPANANIFLHLLEMKRATAFDVLDACASWLRSLAIAQSFINQGTYNNVMVLNSEFNFREYARYELTSVAELGTFCPAFTIGEASTATLLTRDSVNDSFYFTFRNWGHKHDLCMIPLPNVAQYTNPGASNGDGKMKFYADSENLIRFTMKKLISHYRSDPELNGGPYDIVYGHSASETSTTYWMQHAHMSEEQVFRTHARYGNTVSASIPLAISLSLEEQVLKRGMRALAVVGSAGVVTAYSRFVY